MQSFRPFQAALCSNVAHHGKASGEKMEGGWVRMPYRLFLYRQPAIAGIPPWATTVSQYSEIGRAAEVKCTHQIAPEHPPD